MCRPKMPEKFTQLILDSRNGVLSLEERTITREELEACPDTSLENEEFKLFRIRQGNLIFGTRIQK